MNLDQQVCNLELAKRLKKLGVPQNPKTLFWWIHRRPSRNRSSWLVRFYSDRRSKDDIAAFTVSELGFLLPDYLDDPKKEWLLRFRQEKHKVGWLVGYGKLYDCGWYVFMQGRYEANARAKLLIYLLENKLVTI